MFTVRLDAPSPVGVAIDYSVDDVTGHTGGGSGCADTPTPDYVKPALQSVTMLQGDIEATITIDTCVDGLYEADETIEVTLQEPLTDPGDPTSPPLIEIHVASAEGTIRANGTPPTIEVDNPEAVREGAATPLEFTIEVTGDIGQDVTVAYNTEQGTGTDPANPGTTCPPSNTGDPTDYIATAGSHTFSPTDPTPLTHTVEVAVCDDSVGEPEETLELQWNAAPLGDGTATATIEDDEPRLFVVDGCSTQPAYDVCASEADSAAFVFVVERQMHPDVTSTPPKVTVHYVTLPNDPNADSFPPAVAGGTTTDVLDPCSDRPLTVRGPPSYYDYVPRASDLSDPSTLLTIPAGTTPNTASVLVQIHNDSLDEHDESFRLFLCRPSDNAFVDDPWGRAVIEDNDPQPTVMVADAAADEPVDGNDTAELEFTATLSAVSGRDVVLHYYTDQAGDYSPGSVPVDIEALTATAHDDYTAVPRQPPTTATIFAETPASATLTVPVLHDWRDEGDDDLAGAETLALRVSATNAGFSDTSESCAAAQNDNDCALGQIIDNDDPPVVVVDNADEVAEGAQLQFKVRLVDPTVSTMARESDLEVTVDYEVVHRETPGATGLTADGDDLSPPLTGTVTFVRRDVEETVTVDTVDDSLDELDLETLEVRLVANSAVNAVIDTANDRGTGRIADNDDPPLLVVLDTCTAPPWSASVAQSGHACGDENDLNDVPGVMVFTVALVDPSDATTPTTSGRDVSVLFETQQKATGPEAERATGGAAGDAGADYVTVGAATLDHLRRVEIGKGDQTGTFTVQTIGDDTDETDELFLVHMLEDPANPDVVRFPVNPRGQGVIVDNDATELSVRDDCDPVVEGALGPVAVHACDDEDNADGKVVFTVELSNPSSQTVTVDYYTVDLTSQGLRAATANQDYTGHASSPAVSRQKLMIGPGFRTGTIEVQIGDDAVYEHDEVFQLRLAAPSDGTAMNASLRDPSVMGAILDDEDPPRLSVADATAQEGSPVDFTATLLEPVGNNRAEIGRIVSIDYEVEHRDTPGATGLTADSADLSPPLTATLTFDPTRTIITERTQQTASVATIDDDLDETDETFELRVTDTTPTEIVRSPGAMPCPAQSTGTTLDDCAVGTIADNNVPPLLVVLDTCTAPPWSASVAQSGHACGDENDLNDVPGVMVFTVALVDPSDATTPTTSGRDVSVLFETQQKATGPEAERATGGAAGDAGADYVTVGAATLDHLRRVEIGKGDQTGTFTVQTIGDDTDETDELFLVHMLEDPANPDVVRFPVNPRGQGVIVDNDATELSVRDDCDPVVEGALGPVAVHACDDEDNADGKVVFTVELSNPSSQTVTVDYYTVDLTSQGLRAATANQDYTGHASSPAVSRQKLMIGPGFRTGTIEVQIGDDAVYEHDEVFQLRLAAPSDGTAMNASLRDPSVMGAILDDEDPPRLSVADATAQEGSPVDFTATLLEPVGNNRAEIGRIVSIDYEVEHRDTPGATGLTADSADLSPPLTATLTFDPTRTIITERTQQTASVATIDDDLDETDETFELRVTDTTPTEIVRSPGAMPCPAQSTGTALDDCAVGTIADNDKMPQVRVDPVGVVEGDPLEFTVRLVDPDDPDAPWPSGQEVTVTYETVAGAASQRTAGEPCEVQIPVFGTPYDYDYDYIAASGTLTFDPNNAAIAARTAQSVPVTTCDDYHDELDAETLTLGITAATNADLVAGTAAVGTIRDNEGLPVAVIVDTTTEPEHHATAQEDDPVPFAVRLMSPDVPARPGPSDRQVTVPYHTYSTGADTLDATGGTPGPPRVPPDADYEHVPENTRAAVIAARVFETQVDIATFADTVAESDEKFQLVLDDPTNAQRDNNGRIGIGNISDGCIDPAEHPPGQPAPTISVENVQVNGAIEVGEADGEVSITFTIQAHCVDVWVQMRHIDTDGETASSSSDYLVPHGIHRFVAGSTSIVATARITSDDIDEFDEWFTVGVRWNPASSDLPAEYRNAGSTTATIRIVDDDDEPVAQIFGPDAAVLEGEAMNFTVRLAHRNAQSREDDSVVSGKPVSVSYYTCCGSATGDVDYPSVPQSSPVLLEEFPAADSPTATPTVHTFEIVAEGDGVAEFDEYFQVRLSLPDDANAVLDNHRIADGRITDGCINPSSHVDGGHVPAIEHSSRGETETEDTHRNLDGSAYGNPPPWGFPYTLWVQRLCPEVAFEISYSTRDGTAVAGQDYVAASGTLSGTTNSEGWPLDAQGDPLKVLVEVIDDHIDEQYYELFYLDVKWGTSMPDDYQELVWSYFGRISDDDDFEVSVANASGTEGNPVVFEVSATPSSRSVEVSYATMQLLEGDNIAVQAAGASCTGEADYLGADSSADDSRVVFAPVTDPGNYDAGDRVTMPVSIVTCTDDDDEEEDERFQLNISVDSPTSTRSRDRVGATSQSAVGTIRDRDCLDTTLAPSADNPPTLSTSDVTVREDEADPIRVTFTLSPPPCADNVIQFRVVDGTARRVDDFTGPSGGSTWGLVGNSLEYTLVNDGLVEGEETFEVRLHFCQMGGSVCALNSLAAFSYHPGYAALPEAVATVTIADDDCISLDIDNRMPTMTLEPGSEGTYEPASSAEVAENLSAYTLLSLDTPFCETVWVESWLELLEAGPEDFARFHTTGGDFFSGEGTSRRFLERHTTAYRSVIDYHDDDVFEGNERYWERVNWADTLCSAASRFCGQPAVGLLRTIVDNDCVTEEQRNDPDREPVRITIDAPSEVSEAAGSYSVTFRPDRVFCDAVLLNHTASITQSDTASVNDFDADTITSQRLIALRQELTLFIEHDRSSTSGSIVDDELDENNETFTFRAWFPRLDAGWVYDATVTIVDDDPVPLLAVNDVVVAEPVDAAEATMVFTVGLENLVGESIPSGRQVRVSYATNPLGATTEGTEGAGCVDGADYVAASGELVFAPGDETQPVPVTICWDTDTEPDEQLQLRLVSDSLIPSPVNAELGDFIGTGTITGRPRISIRDSNQWAEAHRFEGRLVRRFEVSVSGELTEAATVQWATEDCENSDSHCAHPATAGADYTAESGTLTFGPDNTTGWIEVAVVDDGTPGGLDEYDEVFFVRLANPTGGVVLAPGVTHPDPVGIGHIIDDDDPPTLSFEHTELSVVEGWTLYVYVALDRPSAKPVIFYFHTQEITEPGLNAQEDVDWANVGGRLSIDPGDTRAYIYVRTYFDSIDDPDERLRVIVAAADNARLYNDTTLIALVTIVESECAALNDDAPTLDLIDVTVTEGDSGTILVTIDPVLCATVPEPSLDWIRTFSTAESGDLRFGPQPNWGDSPVQLLESQRSYRFEFQTLEDDDFDDETVIYGARWNHPDIWAGASETYGTVTILDDDTEPDCVDPTTDDPPVITVTDRTITENESIYVSFMLTPPLCETLPGATWEYMYRSITSESSDHDQTDGWVPTSELIQSGIDIVFEVHTYDDADTDDETFELLVRWADPGAASTWASEPPVSVRFLIDDDD